MAQQRIQLPAYSMWAQTPIHEIDSEDGKVIVFALMQDVVVADPSDFLYTVPAGGVYRLDLISHNFYGVPDLWWVIASVNNIIDPLISVPLGTVIRIPTKARLGAAGILNV
jgi:nucleoid-associated protein YgaU